METNIRYIVTNLKEFRTRDLYEKGYCARGSMEIRIKDHKLYLKSDRSSCTKFTANQFRLFLHSMAYILIHNLQKEVLKGSEHANATMKTIQLKKKVTAEKISTKSLIRNKKLIHKSKSSNHPGKKQSQKPIFIPNLWL